MVDREPWRFLFLNAMHGTPWQGMADALEATGRVAVDRSPRRWTSTAEVAERCAAVAESDHPCRIPAAVLVDNADFGCRDLASSACWIHMIATPEEAMPALTALYGRRAADHYDLRLRRLAELSTRTWHGIVLRSRDLANCAEEVGALLGLPAVPMVETQVAKAPGCEIPPSTRDGYEKTLYALRQRGLVSGSR